uniref:Uncharacterized protein n=1 Tax=Arundo donax TaxID=35708 RepID=A0A0A9D1U4_ARUDO
MKTVHNHHLPALKLTPKNAALSVVIHPIDNLTRTTLVLICINTTN